MHHADLPATHFATIIPGRSLAAGAGVLLGRDALAAERKTDPHRWVLISDTHIGTQRDDSRHGTKPAETFVKTVEQVLDLDPRPAGIIISGDMAFLKGQPGNYKLIQELYRPIREAGIPLHLALGNHDHRENFWAAFPEAKPAVTAVDRQERLWKRRWQTGSSWIPSIRPTSHRDCSARTSCNGWPRPSTPITTSRLLVAHHNPEGLTGLQDAAALLQAATDRKQAKADFYGHTHQWQVRREKEIQLVNVPATAWLFDAKEPRGWLDVTLQKAGATVVLNALDRTHAKHGERHELKWRG